MEASARSINSKNFWDLGTNSSGLNSRKDTRKNPPNVVDCYFDAFLHRACEGRNENYLRKAEAAPKDCISSAAADTEKKGAAKAEHQAATPRAEKSASKAEKEKDTRVADEKSPKAKKSATKGSKPLAERAAVQKATGDGQGKKGQDEEDETAQGKSGREGKDENREN